MQGNNDSFNENVELERAHSTIAQLTRQLRSAESQYTVDNESNIVKIRNLELANRELQDEITANKFSIEELESVVAQYANQITRLKNERDQLLETMEASPRGMYARQEDYSRRIQHLEESLGRLTELEQSVVTISARLSVIQEKSECQGNSVNKLIRNTHDTRQSVFEMENFLRRIQPFLAEICQDSTRQVTGKNSPEANKMSDIPYNIVGFQSISGKGQMTTNDIPENMDTNAGTSGR